MNNDNIIKNCFHNIFNKLFVLKSVFSENWWVVSWDDFLICKSSVLWIEKIINNKEMILKLNWWNLDFNQKINFSSILKRFLKIFEKNNPENKFSYKVKENLFIKWNEDFIEFLTFEVIENYLKKTWGDVELFEDNEFVEFKIRMKKEKI